MDFAVQAAGRFARVGRHMVAALLAVRPWGRHGLPGPGGCGGSPRVGRYMVAALLAAEARRAREGDTDFPVSVGTSGSPGSGDRWSRPSLVGGDLSPPTKEGRRKEVDGRSTGGCTVQFVLGRGAGEECDLFRRKMPLAVAGFDQAAAQFLDEVN